MQGDSISIDLKEEPDINSAREKFDIELDNGVRLINYMGHGGIGIVSAQGLIREADVGQMDNTVTPAFVGLTCLINNYAVPGRDSLGELLVNEADAGMVVSWAASGESYNDQATMIGVAFHGLQGDHERLGDAVIAAFQVAPYLVSVYTLLGDPALLIRQE
jgi:hypothetical protein